MWILTNPAQWIQFDAPANEVENLLFAEFFIWEHSSGTHDISTESYHVPAHIRRHIDCVTPGTRLRQRNVKRAKAVGIEKRLLSPDLPKGIQPLITELPGFPHPNLSTCDTYVTAECTRIQYSLPNATTAAPGNELGIFESLDVHYSKGDLDIYFSTLYPDIPNGTYPEERLIDGAIGAIEDTTEYVPTNLEAPLDFDSSWPLIYPQKLVLFQEDDEYYESTGNFNGFWNSKPPHSLPAANLKRIDTHKPSSMPSTAATAPTAPTARPATAPPPNASTQRIPTSTRAATQARSNAASTSPQTSFPSPTEPARTDGQTTTCSGSVTNG